MGILGIVFTVIFYLALICAIFITGWIIGEEKGDKDNSEIIKNKNEIIKIYTEMIEIKDNQIKRRDDVIETGQKLIKHYQEYVEFLKNK